MLDSIMNFLKYRASISFYMVIVNGMKIIENRKTKFFIVLIGTLATFSFSFNHTQINNLTGVYWGAFNPPTGAHAAIIAASLNEIPLKKLIIVVNNHSYKDYAYPLEIRLQLIKEIINPNDIEKVEILWQDDVNKLDFVALRKMTSAPLCAIAGCDAYKKWIDFSTPRERSLYDAIAVIPRSDDIPILFDEIAFILPINSIFQYVSSTKIRECNGCDN